MAYSVCDWWAEPKASSGTDGKARRLAQAVTSTGRALWDQDGWRRGEVEINLRRYCQRGLRGLFQSDVLLPDRANLRVNITKSAVETLVAKVGSNRPRPKLLTNGADWSQQRRVKLLQRFLDGAMRAADVHSTGKEVFRDAMLAGTGVLHVFPNLGKRCIEAERVFPLELAVDQAEAVNGNPLNLFRTKFLDKHILIAGWPKLRSALQNVNPAQTDDLPAFTEETVTRSQSMVQVWEAWHLATYDHDGVCRDGRHVLAVEDVLLVDEPWSYDYFPFSFFHWTKPVRGFWGDSAVAEIRGLEKECNVLLQKVQRAMQLCGQPWILTPQTAKVQPAKFTDEVALQIPYSGQMKPEVVVHAPVHPSLIDQAWTLQRKAFEQLGTNEQQVAGLKPPGIESGRGLEQLSEEHLLRFKSVTQDYEKLLAQDVSRQFLRAAEELDQSLKARGRGGYKVRTTTGRVALDITWSEAKISPDDLTVECWPTSSLPVSPAGRTEEVERWQANGWITPQRAMSLLEFPDLDSETALATADTDLVEYQLEQMLELGKDVLPEEVQNLEYAKQRVVFAIERAVQDGTPADHIDKARIFLEALQAMMPPPAPPVPPGMGAEMAGAATPGAGGGAPPMPGAM